MFNYGEEFLIIAFQLGCYPVYGVKDPGLRFCIFINIQTLIGAHLVG